MDLINIALIVQLFVIINPLSSFSILLTAYKNKLDIRNIIINSVFIAFIIAIVIALAGNYLFDLFNITIDSFRIAGGIVLLLLGLDTIRPKREDTSRKIGKADSIISVIATPLLTGPATISFITIKSYEFGKTNLILNILFAFILVAVIFAIFSYSVSKINPKIINILSSILGLFLTAIAIEMIAKGIQNILTAV